MRRRVAFAVVLAGLLTLSLSGCSGGASDSACDFGETYDEDLGFCVPDGQSQPEPGTGDAIQIAAATFDACDVPDGVDFEGYFNESEMIEFADCVVPIVDAWIDTVYANMRHPAGYFFVPYGVVTQGSCIDSSGSASVDDTALFYCGADETVYLGEQALWDIYSQHGDAAVFLVAAHEVTHHMQTMVGIYDYLGAQYAVNGALPPEAILLAENQADCGSGAFMNYSLDNGSLQPDDDLADLDAIIAAVGIAEGTPGRDHGTTTERVTSFLLSYQSADAYPMAACNQLIPGQVLIDVG